MKFSLIFIAIITSCTFHAQEVFGKWKTIDDNSGEAKSIVEIYKENGKIFGQIKRILKESKRDVRCTECKGDLKDTRVEGMVFIRDLEKDGDKYANGEIIDPENGKAYDAKIWLNEDNPDELHVRGYVSIFYRTQIWKRLEE
ncbi:MAG: DUF2147 domain-containing protein [Psychroflexus sp.]